MRFSITLSLALAALMVGGAFAQQVAHSKLKKPTLPLPKGKKDAIVPGQILVQLPSNQVDEIVSNPLAKAAVSSRLNGAVMRSRLGKTGWTLWLVPEATNTVQMSSELSGPLFMVTPVHKIYPLLTTPNDPDFNADETDDSLYFLIEGDSPAYFRRCWHLDDNAAFAGWSTWPNTWYTAASKPKDATRIAIIDTGCDMNHPDFINAGGNTTNDKFGGQLDWEHSVQFNMAEIDPNGTPDEVYGHGTHVAGLALASGNNGAFSGSVPHGTIGTGYGARGMILRVFDDSGNGTDADAAAAIIYAADQGAEVISLSLGSEGNSPAFASAVKYAFQKGSLVVAAGNEDGNGGGDLGPIYPAACSGAVGVEANGPDYIPATSTYSGYGYYVDIAAPGGDLTFDGNQYNVQFVYSTAMTVEGVLYENPNLFPPYTLNYAYLAGTSMATPQVSGAAAHYFAKFGLKQGNYGNVRALRALQASALGVMGAANGGWEYYQGYGCLNMQGLMANANVRNATVGSIEGAVYFDDVLTANVPVRAVKGTVTITTGTRLDGTYKFDSLSVGQWQLQIPAGPGTVPSTRNVLVKAGCDTPNQDLYRGQFFFDVTPPTVGKWTASAANLSQISGNLWVYDTDTTVSKATIKVGTTAGGSNTVAETEILMGGDASTTDLTSYKFTGLTLVKKRKYYLTLKVVNGIGLTTTLTKTIEGGMGLNGSR